MAKQCPVVHFEMPYRDPKRMAAFYETVFGWKPTFLGEEMGDYVVAETTESENGRPVTPGAINCGFFPHKPESPQHASAVIGVEDIAASMRAVREAGGEVLGEPMDVPGVGRYVLIKDTEGNAAGMLQPGM